jgi:hypothetical protein
MSALEMQTRGRPPIHPLLAVLGHFRSLLSYYALSRAVRVESRLNLGEALERLQQLNNQDEVRVHVSRQKRILVSCAHHGARSNIFHLFTGAFEEHNSRIVLRGRIGMDAAVPVVIGALWLGMLFLALYQLLAGHTAVFSWKSIAGVLLFWGMLEAWYFNGKHDAAVILRSLQQTLETESCPPDLRATG